MSTISITPAEAAAALARESRTLVDILRGRAELQPHATAYTFLAGDGQVEASLTYAELDRRARRIGAWLQSLGAQGERVLLPYPPGADYVAAFLGCLYAGAVAVPAYPPRFNQNLLRLQSIVANAQAKFALTTAQILSRIETHFAEAADLRELAWLATDALEEDDAAADAWRSPVLESHSLAFLQYTSGSTGAPKGVMVSHGNIMANSDYNYRSFGHWEESVSVTWLPAFHDMGLIDGILQPLYSGFPCYTMAPMTFLQRPLRWLEAIERYRATHGGAPNFAYDLCVNKTTPEQRASLDLSTWATAYNGSEPLRRKTLERFAEAFAPSGLRWTSIYPCYGLAEATLKVAGGGRGRGPVMLTVDGAALEANKVVEAEESAGSRTLVSSGRAHAGMRVVIVNPDTFESCPDGGVGEFWVSSESVAQGYWNREELSEQTFRARIAGREDEGPFLRTGDLGFTKDGELYITGRLKDLIIIAGRNHYPQDIEQTVEQSHPALRAGCVAACSISEGDDEEQLLVVAEVNHRQLREREPDGDSPAQPAQIDFRPVLRAIRRAVSEEHDLQVAAILLLRTGSIPKTSSGKIKRHACREGYLDNTLEALAR